MKHPVANRVIAVLFLCLLLLPVLTMNRQQGKISVAENRYLATFPQLYQDDGTLNQNLQEEFTSWFGDNLGLRDQLIQLSSSIQYNLFHQSFCDYVEIGRDGWLFYTLEGNMDIARGAYPYFNEDVLAEICRQQIAIQTKLAEQGIEYVLVLPPSKVSIYPEFIQSGDYGIIKTPCDILTDYLREHSNVKVINLKPALLKAKEQAQIYFKTDTHWTPQGSYAGYAATVDGLINFGLIRQEPTQVTYVSKLHPGDLADMMLGHSDQKMLEAYYDSDIVNPLAIKWVAGDATYDALSNALAAINDPCTHYSYTNDQVDGPSALMFGDSMFGNWNTETLLAENFSEFTFLWTPNMNQDIIDFVHPDIVLYELGERNLNSILPTANLPYIQ